MSIRVRGDKYYVAFRWKKHRMEGVTRATSKAEAKKMEKDIHNAFSIYRFDHLEPKALEVVMRLFQNKGWALPPELRDVAPERELTLSLAVEDYLKADRRHGVERNHFAIKRLTEHFGDDFPLKEIKIPQLKRYQRDRKEEVSNGTVNREFSVLSGIMRVQIELGTIDFNPCLMVKRLPENQRDTYLSWQDYKRLQEHSWWLSDLILILFYTGMRFNELVSANWDMFKPERRMLILPPDLTKEGKSEKKSRLRVKRIPLRHEPFDLLCSRRMGMLDRVGKIGGPLLTYAGRYKSRCGVYQGYGITYGMARKAWRKAVSGADLVGLQLKDLRHSWKTNAMRSGMDPTVRNAIVGHSSHRSVEDRYIRLSDEALLNAVDTMSFDHGCTEFDIAESG